ncbi:hypothetical protein DYI24_06260 [Rhodopseudomonas sp. BR0C11]|uniref:hypothetical protein n=1 Tax=Rhodopseudomonas sp. BR0C11 TaxID=2269370 RepID=UPI0013DF5931|nr:hypothetical protein [Rhodopseudomonas sp. BR0C11]NEV76644.1 hypothetical protein [Rhodopseudomonas sp. BR0C11]
MIFALDERGWGIGKASAAEWIESLELTLDLIDELIERGHHLAYPDTFFSQPILLDHTLYDLYSPTSSIEIPADVRDRLAAIFSRAARLEDLFVCPQDINVDFGFGPERAETIAWAASKYLHEHEITPCISRAGKDYCNAIYGGQKVPIWLVDSAQMIEGFFRWLIIHTTHSPGEMAQLLSEAFKELEFVEGAVDGIKTMSGSYSSLVQKIVHDLGFLSDEGARIFSKSWQDAAGEFGAGNVTISDENGNTKQNRRAKKKRTIKYAGADRLFWWHIKLQPHQNRIHIYPDNVSVGGKIVVGIFCHHL